MTGTATVSSGMLGSYLAYFLGVGSTSVGTAIIGGKAVATGLLLISNPTGWAIVLSTAIIGGGLAYRSIKEY